MKKRKLLWFGLVLAAVYLLLLFLLVAAEADAPGASICSLPTALWFSFTTLTTVGYGDTYPVTVAGRIIGVLFQLLSVGLLAFLIGAFISFMRGRLLPMLRLRLRRGRDWYAFSSLNEATAALASSLAQEKKNAVIMFLGAEDGAKPPAGFCIASDPQTLLRMKKGRGTLHLFCMSDDYLENEQLAHALAGKGCRVYCMSPYEPERLSADEIRFNPYTCCARLYWSTFPITSAKEEIILIGGGKYGEALLEQALQVNVLDDSQEIYYRLFGSWAGFRRNHPYLSQLAGEPGDRIVFEEKEWNEDPKALEKADRIIFCDDGEREICEQIACLKKYFPALGKAYARLSAPLDGVIRFGAPQDIYTPELVMRAEMDRLARTLHEIYRSSASSPQPAWEELSSFTRRSNLASADHLSVKLRILLGQDAAMTPENCAEAYRAFSAADARARERLRKIEHERWMRFHILNNWRYAPKRDNEKRLHPLLVPFEQLSLEEQQKDDYGWELLKDLSVQSVGKEETSEE